MKRDQAKLMRKCPGCEGCGQVEVTGVYAETYFLLQKNPGGITGAALAGIAGCKPTAMNNRLTALERMGFVESKKYGRERHYRTLELITQ